jgi:hypothetical protein
MSPARRAGRGIADTRYPGKFGGRDQLPDQHSVPGAALFIRYIFLPDGIEEPVQTV